MDIKQEMGFSLPSCSASDGFKFDGDEKTCIDFQNEVDEKGAKTAAETTIIFISGFVHGSV